MKQQYKPKHNHSDDSDGDEAVKPIISAVQLLAMAWFFTIH